MDPGLVKPTEAAREVLRSVYIRQRRGTEKAGNVVLEVGTRMCSSGMSHLKV